eukprot:COSAG05_NODE_5882_length_1067_cov_1.336777_2_plen_90_part_00
MIAAAAALALALALASTLVIPSSGVTGGDRAAAAAAAAVAAAVAVAGAAAGRDGGGRVFAAGAPSFEKRACAWFITASLLPVVACRNAA